MELNAKRDMRTKGSTAIIAPRGGLDPSKPFGGAEVHALHLARVLISRGRAVHIYDNVARPRTVEPESGLLFREGQARQSCAVLVARAIADGCSHVHFQDVSSAVPVTADRAVLSSATQHGVYWDLPYVDGARDWYPGGRSARAVLPVWRWAKRTNTRARLARLDNVLATDSSFLHLVQGLWPEQRHKVSLIRNFVDLDGLSAEEYQPLTDAVESARYRGRRIVFVPRNVSLARGTWMLPDIVRGLMSRGCDDVVLLVAGGAHSGSRSGKRAREVQSAMRATLPRAIQERIVWLGSVPRGAMRCGYEAADVVLIPTFYFESTSLAALEALALGAPTVCTNIGGLNDIIVDGVTGLLAMPHAGSIAEQVDRLMRDSGLAARVGRQGKEWVTEAHSLERWRESVGYMFDRALNSV